MSLSRAVLGILLVLPSSSARPAQEDGKALIAELSARGNAADVALVRKVANLRTSEAVDALIQVHDRAESMTLRKAILEGLALYDEVPGLEQRALQKITDAATLSPEAELRRAAVDTLAGCQGYGKAFLSMIVESAAAVEVRERAMKRHVERAAPEDHAWYERLFAAGDPEPGEKEKKEKPHGKKGEAHGVGLRSVRRLAFGALTADLSTRALEQAADDSDPGIVAAAIEELDRRGEGAAQRLAEELYERTTAQPAERLVGARILLAREPEKLAQRLLKDMQRKDTPEELAFGLADMLAEVQDPELVKALIKSLGKVEGRPLVVTLRAARKVEDPKLDDQLIELIDAEDGKVRRAALRMLGERRAEDALPRLESFLTEAEDAAEVGDALEAIGAIRENAEAWIGELQVHATHADLEVRNAALKLLGESGQPAVLPALVQALSHESWSTRLAAANAIEQLRVKEGVGALCARAALEEGRIAAELGRILFRLTGRPFAENGAWWRDWWEREGAVFEFPSSAELEQRARTEPEQRHKTAAIQFFGIKLESRRVAFVLDVSGSMQDPIASATGEGEVTRLVRAAAELERCLDELEEKSFFNLITFSDGVTRWKPRITELTPETLADAKSFVERFRAGGGTNLFGGVSAAFEDQDVDTVYVLSDGEPTAGDIKDPAAIRSTIAGWNARRGVKIHCISVGLDLAVLRWLAEDSGGTYLQLR